MYYRRDQYRPAFWPNETQTSTKIKRKKKKTQIKMDVASTVHKLLLSTYKLNQTQMKNKNSSDRLSIELNGIFFDFVHGNELKRNSILYWSLFAVLPTKFEWKYVCFMINSAVNWIVTLLEMNFSLGSRHKSCFPNWNFLLSAVSRTSIELFTGARVLFCLFFVCRISRLRREYLLKHWMWGSLFSRE